MDNKKYFYGNEVSEHGVKNGFVDYRAFAKSFNAVLNNDIMQSMEEKGFYFDIVNGDIETETEDGEYEYKEVFQWYIVDDCGASIIQSHTNEILFYCEELDLYLWGVTHYGTAWDYVLTEIKL